jgi:RND superfamily putative drug exporter
VLSATVPGEFSTEFQFPGSESKRAIDLLEESGASERGGIQGQVVFEAEQGVDDPEVQEAIEGFLSDIGSTVNDVQIVSPFEPGNEHQVSASGLIAYAELNFSDRDFEEYSDQGKEIKALRDDLNVDGLRIELGGDMFADEPSFSNEFIGILAAVVILLIAFGSVIAMGLPILTALFGIGSGIALITIGANIAPIPEFTTQLAAMIGLGVGIDYALLIVSRYRDALRDGLDPEDAVLLSLNTSGRAVLFAGITVVIALLGMWMMDLQFIRAVSTSAVLVVFLTMGAALTLLPALLGFAGRNIDKFGLPHRKEAPGEIRQSFWYRWSRIIQGNPWPALIVSAGLLVILTIPALSMRLGFGDAGNRPETDTSRSAGSDGGSPDEGALGDLKAALEGTEGVASVGEPIPVADSVALMNVFPEFEPQDEETTDLVHRLRNDTIAPIAEASSLTILTTGASPGVVDFADYVSERLPLFIGAVLLLSFILLLVVFHSVVVPIKAVLMNLLSIGAAFGVMVAVFQWGWGAELIGIDRAGPIEAWAPMMLFAIVFGLSMDYEVFLLTRIREEYDRTGDNNQAVADGLAATGRVITAAAAIMVCVFSSFVLGDLRDVKLFGFGLAIAILIDATIVRMVLVPAAMELMGNANWWAPRWLLKVLPTIRVDGAEDFRPIHPAAESPGS